MSNNMFMQKVAGLARATELLLEEKKQYKQAAVNTVGKLVELGAVKKEDREKVANSIANNKDKIFDVVTQLATVNQKHAAELKKKAAELKKASAAAPAQGKVKPLGAADTSIKESAVKEKSSDEIWENTFGV